ncbi:MAG: class I SAM-dependent rRNA methyltransferase [Pleomorphochaeta sp.]
MNTISIKKGKEKQIKNHHPWVFSGAINKVDATSPCICKVVDYNNSFIGYGYYDKLSNTPIHLLSWKIDEIIDDIWWENKIIEAINRRADLIKKAETNAYRLIFSEADFIPGIVADYYNGFIRIIISSRAAYAIKDIVAKTLFEQLKPNLIILNTDKNFCGLEKLKEETFFYNEDGYFTPKTKFEPIQFTEESIDYEIIPGTGQKSGFFCDQRDNRVKIEKYCDNKIILDGCSYTGGFTLHALKAGAKHVDALDSSNFALKSLLKNIHININNNKFAEGTREKVETKVCNIFEEMREIKEDYYDLMILDPPKLAKKRSQVDNASRAYKDLNRMAMKKIKDNGIIASFSCSSAIDLETFRTILSWAAIDNNYEIQILETLSAASDHPVRISFPESNYLCGFIFRVIK